MCLPYFIFFIMLFGSGYLFYGSKMSFYSFPWGWFHSVDILFKLEYQLFAKIKYFPM